jgi:hypothetical protein
MGIPLVALMGRPPEITDPQTIQMNAARIRALQGQNQLQPGELQEQQQRIQQGQNTLEQQAITLKDQKAQTAAWQQWDHKNPDDLTGLIVKNGGSGNAAAQMQQTVLGIRAKASDVAKNDAETGAKNLETEQKMHDDYRGRLTAIIGTSDPAQKQQQWDSEITKEEQAGQIKPGSVSHTYPGDDQAKEWASHYALGSVLAKEAIEKQKADTEQQKAETGEWKEFPSLGILVNTKDGRQISPTGGAAMTPGMMEAKYVALGQKKNQGQALAPDEQAFMKSYAQMKELVPAFTIRNQFTGGGFGPGAGGGPGGGGNGGNGNAPAPAPDINKVPLMLRNQVKAVLDYRSPMPPQGRNSAVNTAVRQWVNTIDPNYDETTFPQRNKVLTEYVKDAGTGEIGAINTALGHLGELNAAAKALSTNDLPFLHSLASKYNLATGGDAASTYEMILHRVGPEMTKAYLKGGGTEGERGSNEADFALSKGAKQITSNIAESAQLLNSKLASKRQNWDETFRPASDAQKFDNRFLTPDAKKTLDTLSGQAPTNKTQATGAGNLPQGAGKMIDKATAQKFYDAAGRDPKKAQALAEQNGWRVQ